MCSADDSRHERPVRRTLLVEVEAFGTHSFSIEFSCIEYLVQRCRPAAERCPYLLLSASAQLQRWIESMLWRSADSECDSNLFTVMLWLCALCSAMLTRSPKWLCVMSHELDVRVLSLPLNLGGV